MAKLSVTYSREVLVDGYFLGVEINPAPATDPTGKLEESLVINTSDEDMARFATLTDLEDLSVGPGLYWFQADSYAGTPLAGVPAMNDRLVFETVPGSWDELADPPPALRTYSIAEVTGPPYAIRVTTPFPCGFTGTVTYHILVGAGGSTVRVSSLSSRVVIRRYDPNGSGSPLYVRVASAAELFPSIDTATNKYAALRAEAGSLIEATDLEEESFTGSITEVYD
jgi:hypothetical protein